MASEYIMTLLIWLPDTDSLKSDCQMLALKHYLYICYAGTYSVALIGRHWLYSNVCQKLTLYTTGYQILTL